MNDPRSVIERSLSRVGSESYTLESFYRRRDRKRTRQRLAAGVVGIAIAIGIAVTGSAILRSAPDHLPADTRGPILRQGEVLQVVDENSDSASLVATDPATGRQRILHGCTECGWINDFALSTEGGWVAWEQMCNPAACSANNKPGIWVVGADGPEIHVATPPDAFGGGWIWAWSPAADQLAFATGRSGLAELVLFDPSMGERTSVTTVEGISALSWSPDGTAIAIASPSSGVSIFDIATGRSTSIARIGTVEDHDLSWSPDGTRLVLASHGSIIVVSADGSDRRVLVDHGASGPPAWSPDSTRIAYLGTSGSGRRASPEVWVIGADGSDATRVFHAECCPGEGSGPVWSPDGSRIAFWIYEIVPFNSQLVVNADGTGSPEQVDDVVVDGWIQG
jgi:Tol biopolymer transport system component